MTVLGIDPGTTTTGFGILEYNQNQDYKVINYGIIETKPKIAQQIKLKEIFEDLNELIAKYKPDILGVEKVFYNTNPKTVISVSQARGISLLCAGIHNIKVFEYTPLQVKNAVVGYGRAEKKQVQYMIKNILKLKETPKPDDAADALAVAICAILENKSI